MSKCNPSRIFPASFAWIVLLFATGIFFVFPCRYLMSVYSIAIPVFQSIVTFFVTVNFGLATFVNPGTIPKASPDELKDNTVSCPTYQDIEIHGVRVRLKWCVTCNFYRPPRCVHCGICDTCIETFDHHCPWVNNCIGRRNYRYFFMFLLWLTIHMTSILTLCVLYMKDHLNNIKQLETVMTLTIIAIIVILFIPIFGLTGYHVILIIQGQTTNEKVTRKFSDVRSPYSKGCLKNILYVLCNSPLPRYKIRKSVYIETKEFSKVKVESRNSLQSEASNYNKLYSSQYQLGSKRDHALSQENHSFENDQQSWVSLLNRGSLHLSLNESICARQMDSSYKSKSSRALTPPVPTRFDYSRRSLPPHNKFHASSPSYTASYNVIHKDISRISGCNSDHLPISSLYYPPTQNSASKYDYGVPASSTCSASALYLHLPEGKDGFHGERYAYAISNPNENSDTCCLGNHTVDKLQEIANRSVMSGQCTDVSVLEVFPKACSSFHNSPTKEKQDGHQLLGAQTSHPLYLRNYEEGSQGVANHCHNDAARDFPRTPGNRPLSFVKAMEMSEGLEWSDPNVHSFRMPGNSASVHLACNTSNYKILSANSTRGPEDRKGKSDPEISYEISV